MRNGILLLIYAVLFSAIVGSYENYRDNPYLVSLAAATLLVTGLVFWLVSIRNGLDK
jgi:hypothetical protein